MFSEFGRRVKDNGQGTDHGAAAPMFCIGGHGKSGRIFGENPNLEQLEEGDIRYQIDFRSVYASILEKRRILIRVSSGLNRPLWAIFRDLGF